MDFVVNGMDEPRVLPGKARLSHLSKPTNIHAVPVLPVAFVQAANRKVRV